MRFSTRLLLASLTLPVLSCITPSIPLEENGTNIPIKRDVTRKQLKGFTKVKFITCDQGSNGRSLPNNMQSCENHLRNEAGRVGAKFVVIETLNEKESERYGKCNNCLSMTGWAYDVKKAEADDDHSDESEPENH